MVGVTGTNGKTTTTYLLESIFRAAGLVPGRDRHHRRTHRRRAGAVARTTPEAPDLQRLLAVMRDEGVRPSPWRSPRTASTQHRVDGMRFDVAVFTNLSQDHLDYHADMEAYFAAKAGCSRPELAAAAAIGIDDEAGRRLRGRVGGRRTHVRPVRGRRRAGRRRRASTWPASLPRGRPVHLDFERPFNVRTAWRAGGRAAGGHRRPRSSAAGIAPCPACPAASSPSTRARRSSCWSTTRTRPTASRRARARRASWRRAASSSCSGAAAIATGPSARSWERRRPRRGPDGDHQRQPSVRGPARDHRGDRGRAGAERRRWRVRRRARPPARRSGAPCARPAPGDVVVIAGKGHETGPGVRRPDDAVRRPDGGARRSCASIGGGTAVRPRRTLAEVARAVGGLLRRRGDAA